MLQRFSLLAALALGCLVVAAPAAAATRIADAKRVSGPGRDAHQADADLRPGPLIAPRPACPGQGSLTAPAETQERAMACMVNYARLAHGLEPLAEEPSLGESAALKSRDMIGCGEFSHYACGREFTHWMAATGYLSRDCWRVGENIAWGRGRYGTVRSIFIAWLRSDTHRENILGDFASTGLDMTVGRLEGRGGTRVWTQHFGLFRCEPAPPPPA